MLPAVAFLIAGQVSKPLVAFVARYYQPNRRTHEQVYVCDLNGSHVRAVTAGTADCSGVRWAGADRLVWFTEAGDKITKWTMTWPNGSHTSEVLVGEPWHLHDSFADFSPEHAILDKSDTPYEISPSTGKLVDPPVQNPLGLIETLGGQSGSGTVKGTAFAWELKDSKINLSSESKRWELPLADGVNSLLWQPKREILWVREWTHDSTMGGHTSISKVDFAKHELEKVIDDAGRTDFWPDRDLYAYNKPRDLAPIGKKQVWVSPLIIGSQRTGVQKTIVSGLVWVHTMSLRPVP